MSMSIYSQVEGNKTKTYLIMALFMGFIALVAYIFGQASGYGISYAGIALMISGILTLASYYYGDRLVLALSGAHPADRNKDFDFYTVAENLSIAAGLPTRKLHIIDDT